MAERVGGVIVRHGQALQFVPEQVVRRVVQRPIVSRLPGTELGLSLIAGRVMAVIGIGPENTRGSELVVCEVSGESVALSGLDVVRSGSFEQAEGGVLLDGALVPTLNVAGEVLRVELELKNRRLESLQRRP